MRKKLEPARLILFFTVFSVVHGTIGAKDLVAKSLRIFPDLESDWFLDGELDFGCEITYDNGGKRRTTGYLNGNVPWNQLVVESQQAAAYGDQLLVDLYKVRNNNQTLVIKVRLKNNPEIETVFDVKVPPVESISIFLPNRSLFHLGRKLSPCIAIQWANRFQTEFSACDKSSIIPLDSLQIFMNDHRVYDCRITLPERSDTILNSFSISVIWTSKPWINCTSTYAMDTSTKLGLAKFNYWWCYRKI